MQCYSEAPGMRLHFPSLAHPWRPRPALPCPEPTCPDLTWKICAALHWPVYTLLLCVYTEATRAGQLHSRGVQDRTLLLHMLLHTGAG